MESPSFTASSSGSGLWIQANLKSSFGCVMYQPSDHRQNTVTSQSLSLLLGKLKNVIMCIECSVQCQACDKQAVNCSIVIVISLLALLTHFIQHSQKVQCVIGVLK